MAHVSLSPSSSPENSQSDFVLFQSISTIREAVIREWPILPAEEKVELRGYLMQYLTSHPSLAPYVRSEVLHTVALLVKRSTLEVNCEQLFGSVLDSAAQMLSSAEVRTVGVVVGVALWVGKSVVNFVNSTTCSPP